jgi:hypothetical protein
MLTNTIYKEGFGENFKFIIYSMLYAEYLREEFHYTPFNDLLEHNYDKDVNFVDKKEKLINLINHYPVIKKDLIYKNPDRFELLHFFENNVDFCFKSKTLKKLKIIFKEANKDKFDKSFFNIAIHIRRMNILDIEKNINFKQIPGSDVPNELYKVIIGQFKNNYKNSKIHIYSQGDKKDFYFQGDIVLHINTSLEDTFVDMVYADILVIAPSSLSYSAGLISDGIVYFINSCNTPLSSWNMVQNYISTKDRYLFFVRKSPTEKVIIYYDTKTGVFYEENSEKVRTYINIYDYFKK